MKLESYQNKLIEVSLPLKDKDKLKAYTNSLLGINKSIANIEDISISRFSSQGILVSELADALFYSFRLNIELDSTIMDSFNLEGYKNQINTHQKLFEQTLTTDSITFDTYLKPCRLSLGKLNQLIKDGHKVNGDFDEPVKVYISHYLYNVITRLMLLINFYGFNIDVILENSLNKLALENTVENKTDKKKEITQK